MNRVIFQNDIITSLEVISPKYGSKVINIDTEDYPRIRMFKWYVCPSFGTFYARSAINRNEKILLHRLIMSFPNFPLEIDHKDFDGLNNTKNNLRLCTHAENQAHKSKLKSRSKYRGVYWNIYTKKYTAKIGKPATILGHFYSEDEAAEIYNIEAKNRYGDFAMLNIIGENYV